MKNQGYTIGDMNEYSILDSGWEDKIWAKKKNQSLDEFNLIPWCEAHQESQRGPADTGTFNTGHL